MKKILTAFLFPLLAASAVALAADPTLANPIGEAPNPFSRPSYETAQAKPVPSAWKWSLAPLAASQALDIASSYGMRELNPMLAGPQDQFGMKATLIKAGVTAAVIGAEYLIVKTHPRSARMLTTVNWSAAALTSGFAIHNFSIR